ncbi:hypothetical protein GOBAR_DD21033 [Gossypium barbadense]|nr:hypothetical protein GOBAR_DD21033 [Gossypium barbadense]
MVKESRSFFPGLDLGAKEPGLVFAMEDRVLRRRTVQSSVVRNKEAPSASAPCFNWINAKDMIYSWRLATLKAVRIILVDIHKRHGGSTPKNQELLVQIVELANE